MLLSSKGFVSPKKKKLSLVRYVRAIVLKIDASIKGFQQLRHYCFTSMQQNNHLLCNVSNTFDIVQLKYHQAQSWAPFQKTLLGLSWFTEPLFVPFAWHVICQSSCMAPNTECSLPTHTDTRHLLIHSRILLFVSLSFSKT